MIVSRRCTLSLLLLPLAAAFLAPAPRQPTGGECVRVLGVCVFWVGFVRAWPRGPVVLPGVAA